VERHVLSCSHKYGVIKRTARAFPSCGWSWKSACPTLSEGSNLVIDDPRLPFIRSHIAVGGLLARLAALLYLALLLAILLALASGLATRERHQVSLIDYRLKQRTTVRKISFLLLSFLPEQLLTIQGTQSYSTAWSSTCPTNCRQSSHTFKHFHIDCPLISLTFCGLPLFVGRLRHL